MKIQDFLLNLERVAYSGELVCFPCAGLTGDHHFHLAFMWVLDFSTFVLILAYQVLSPLRYPSRRRSSFLVTLAVLGLVFLYHLCFNFVVQFYIFRGDSACLVQLYTV